MNPRRLLGRDTLLVLVVCGIAMMALLFSHYGYERTWRLWDIPALSPSFADARTITAGAESHALGYDPLVSNPRDPWHRPMNYPRVWQLLFYFPISQHDTGFFGVTFAVLFLVAIFLFTGDIDRPTAYAMAFCIFSPAVLYGVERGNNDLLIFFLLALSIRLIAKFPYISAGLVGFSFLLKLFPIFAITAFVRERKPAFRMILSGGLLFAAVYAVLMHGELRLIRMATPKPAFGSYGIDTGWMKLQFDQQPSRFAALARIASYASVILVAVFSVLQGRLRPQTVTGSHLDAFRVGASIYLVTFLIGANFDYRLLFLLFVIPQLISWLSCPKPWIRYVSAITAASTLVSLWSLVVGRIAKFVPGGRYAHSVLDLTVNGLIFAGLFNLLICSYVAPVGAGRKAELPDRQPAGAGDQL